MTALPAPSMTEDGAVALVRHVDAVGGGVDPNVRGCPAHGNGGDDGVAGPVDDRDGTVTSGWRRRRGRWWGSPRRYVADSPAGTVAMTAFADPVDDRDSAGKVVGDVDTVVGGVHPNPKGSFAYDDRGDDGVAGPVDDRDGALTSAGDVEAAGGGVLPERSGGPLPTATVAMTEADPSSGASHGRWRGGRPSRRSGETGALPPPQHAAISGRAAKAAIRGANCRHEYEPPFTYCR